MFGCTLTGLCNASVLGRMLPQHWLAWTGYMASNPLSNADLSLFASCVGIFS